MTKVLLFLGVVLSLGACHSGTQGKLIQLRQEAHLESAKKRLYSLADTAGLRDTNISSLLNPMVMDGEGLLKSVEMNRALELYLENNTSTKAEQSLIFEVKNSTKVILHVSGNGLWGPIWGDVLLDRSNMEIVGIAFDHQSETPGLGTEITKRPFCAQFEGGEVKMEPHNFGLFQDGEKVLEGAQRIDGVSGATVTSKGVVLMLNNGLLKYQAFLESE